ncbi:unnamed protein product [Meloidogyne enterolobii]|uniref:Uncharacterized protein n=1 Tax=Meloidogyne enterolobii TaxID=390850 RepID=A0ACB1AE76_MELEN
MPPIKDIPHYLVLMRYLLARFDHYGNKVISTNFPVLNHAIVLIKFFDNFRGGATADEKKTEQITSQINVKKGFDEGEG